MSNRRLHVEALEDRHLLAAMPQLVKDINTTAFASSDPSNLAVLGGTVFFTASTPTTGIELWKSDGTEAGTVRVKDIRPGIDGSNPNSLTNVNGTLYFNANDGIAGEELWTSDGTEAGTVMVMDLVRGSGGSNPGSITEVGGKLFFTAVNFGGSI